MMEIISVLMAFSIIGAISYFVACMAHRIVRWFLVWSGLDKTDWFHDINEENK